MASYSISNRSGELCCQVRWIPEGSGKRKSRSKTFKPRVMRLLGFLTIENAETDERAQTPYKARKGTIIVPFKISVFRLRVLVSNFNRYFASMGGVSRRSGGNHLTTYSYCLGCSSADRGDRRRP